MLSDPVNCIGTCLALHSVQLHSSNTSEKLDTINYKMPIKKQPIFKGNKSVETG